MKNTNDSKHVLSPANVETSAVARYQIYRQARTGAYQAEFKTDSAAEVVEAFLHQAPAFDGGEIRIWNHREQRVSAAVVWRTEKTDFGFPVHHRTNEFHDRLLGVIARQLQEREALRETIQQDARASLTV